MHYLNLTKCDNCSLDCRFKVHKEGPLTPDLMVIGEAPNSQDFYGAEPFVSDGGSLIKKTLHELQKANDLSLNIHYTNLVLCKTPERQPSESEVVNCFGRLTAEIEHYKPKAILILGALTAKMLLGTKTIKEARGKLTSFQGIKAVASYNGAYILREPSLFQTLVNDMCLLLEDNDYHWDEKRVFTLVETDEQFDACYTDIRSQIDPTALDLETHGLDAWTGFPFWIGLRTDNTTYIIHDDHFKKHTKNFPAECAFVVHDAKMEYPWMRFHYGIELNNIDCTLVLAHMVDSRTGNNVSKSLKELGHGKLGVHDWEHDMKPYLKGRVHEAPFDIVTQYLSYDVEVDRALFFKLKDEMAQPEPEIAPKDKPLHDKLINQCEITTVEECYDKVVRPSIPFLNKLTCRGIRVDLEYLDDCGDLLKYKIKQIKEEIACFTDVNPNSPVEISKYLFQDLKLPDKEKGSTNEKVLKALQAETDTPFIDLLLDYRKYSKMHSTYITGLMDQVTTRDGRVHSKFLLDGTATGRLSSKEPNLQNIPRPSTCPTVVVDGVKHVINIRQAFIPEDGCMLGDCDYNQLEFRVGVHLSGDKNAIEFIKADKDIHAEMAAQLTGVPVSEVPKQMRQFAKNMVFATMFDASIDGLVYMFKKDFPFIDKQIAERFIKHIRISFPDLYFNALDMKKFAKRFNYVQTIFGRRRYFPLITRDNEKDIMKQATNSPIQGSASDICLLAAQRIEREVEGVYIHMLVHDSIVFSYEPNADIKAVQQIMADVPFDSDVLFKTEFKSGSRWGLSD